MSTNLQTRPLAHNHTRRQRTIALATVGSAVTLLVSEATDPVGDATAQNLLAAAETHPTLMVVSSLLLLSSAVLLIPAIVGMVRLMPHRGAGVGHAGAVLLALGAFGHAMAATFFLVVAAMPSGPLPTDGLTALVEHLNTSATLIPAFAFIIAFGLGLMLTFIGLHRAGAIPSWVLGTIIGAGLLEFAAPGDVAAIGLVKQSLVLIAFAYLGTRHRHRSADATAFARPAGRRSEHG